MREENKQLDMTWNVKKQQKLYEGKENAKKITWKVQDLRMLWTEQVSRHKCLDFRERHQNFKFKKKSSWNVNKLKRKKDKFFKILDCIQRCRRCHFLSFTCFVSFLDYLLLLIFYYDCCRNLRVLSRWEVLHLRFLPSTRDLKEEF